MHIMGRVRKLGEAQGHGEKSLLPAAWGGEIEQGGTTAVRVH